MGLTAALGSVVTMVSQLLWTRIADKAAGKGRVLALNLLLLAGSAGLFFLGNITLPILLLITVLFYSFFMVHQPLIDTIAAEACKSGGKSFAWFRSFASLCYGVMGIFFTVSPGKHPNSFFWYVILLALLSSGIALFSPKTAVPPKTETQHTGISGVLNRTFVLFLVYTFLSFLSSAILTTFFPVYYTDAEAIGGTQEFFSLLITVGTLLEWLVMLLFDRTFGKLRVKTVFLLLAIFGAMRSVLIWLISDEYLVSSTVLFHGLWYGLFWCVSTPYMVKIMPPQHFATAQGIWTVVAFGISPFIGSLVGGKLAVVLGLRELFLLLTVMMVGLAVITPLLFPNEKKSSAERRSPDV